MFKLNSAGVLVFSSTFRHILVYTSRIGTPPTLYEYKVRSFNIEQFMSIRLGTQKHRCIETVYLLLKGVHSDKQQVKRCCVKELNLGVCLSKMSVKNAYHHFFYTVVKSIKPLHEYQDHQCDKVTAVNSETNQTSKQIQLCLYVRK